MSNTINTIPTFDISTRLDENAEIDPFVTAINPGTQIIERQEKIISAHIGAEKIIVPAYPVRELLSNVTNFRAIQTKQGAELKLFGGYKWENDWIRDRYDQKAPLYYSTLNRLRKISNLQSLGVNITDTILDIGSGASDIIASIDTLQNYIALDISMEMLLQGRQRWRTTSAIQGIAEHLPFKDRSIGSSFMIYSIDRIPNPEKALDEVSRVTKTGGKLIIINEFPLNSAFGNHTGINMLTDLAFLSRLVQSKGFEIFGWSNAEYICTDLDGGIDSAVCFILVFDKR